MKSRRFALPIEVDRKLRAVLETMGTSIDDSRPLADAVLRLSDHFTSGSRVQTPWKDSNLQKAYLSYFYPLNFLRLTAVLEQGLRLGFFGHEPLSVVDFGSGVGTAHQALVSAGVPIKSFAAVEISPEAKSIHRQLLAPHSVSWLDDTQVLGEVRSRPTLGVFSYSLNELEQPPQWLFECERLLIVEPSTQKQARQLLQLRQILIDKGYSMWAPCTHQQECPLLAQSERDWCHDRIFVDMPEWYQNLEKHLPLENRSLTFSYLLASRQPAPEKLRGLVRVIGDTLKEKGKTRQMACRGPEREFLTWLKRAKVDQSIARGEVVSLPSSTEKKSNELRLSEPVEIVDLDRKT